MCEWYEALTDWERTLPSFAVELVERETQVAIDRLDHLLVKSSALEICRNANAFTEITRIISGQAEALGSKYTKIEKFENLILAMWRVATEPSLDESKRCRALNALANLVDIFVTRFVPRIWESPTSQTEFGVPNRAAIAGRLAAEIRWNDIWDLLIARYEASYRGDLGTSGPQRKLILAAWINLCSSMRSLWDIDADEIVPKMTLDDKNKIKIYLSIRMAMLFASGKTCYDLTKSGKLFEWWSICSGSDVASWDASLLTLLFRAMKFAWATGAPVPSNLMSNFDFLSQILLRTVRVPVVKGIPTKFHSESVPGEFTVLLEKPLAEKKKLAKVLVLILNPQCEVVWDCLRSLTATVLPYCHPSNPGKCAGAVAVLVAQLVNAYCKRVGRERSGLMRDVSIGNLGRRDDLFLWDIVEPLVSQGLHSKLPSALNSFEDATKRLCTLIPDVALPIIIPVLTASLESLTEPHLVQSTLRLLPQLSSSILINLPTVVPAILQLTLPAVDPSDPIKAVQALTFFTILLSQIPLADQSNVEVDIPEHREAFHRIRNLLKFESTESTAPWINYQKYPDPADCMHPKTFTTFDNCIETINARRLTSSLVPDICQELFNSILRFSDYSTESVSQEKSTTATPGAQSLERSVEALTRSCLAVIVSRVDETNFKILLDVFAETILDRSPPENQKLGASIGLAFSSTRPEMSLRRIVPNLAHQLLSNGKLKINLSKSYIIWRISVLSQLVRRGGSFIVEWEEPLTALITECIHNTESSIAKAGAKLFRRVLEGVLSCHCRPNGSEANIVSWGFPWWVVENVKPSEFNPNNYLSWYCPNQREVNFAENLVALIGGIANSFIKVSFVKSIARPDEDQLITETRETILSSPDDKIESLSTFRLLSRGLRLWRYALKGVTVSFPDENVSITNSERPIINPIESSALTEKISRHATGLVFAIAAHLLDFHINFQTLACLPTPSQVIPEESRIMLKSLKLANQVLVRKWATPSPRGASPDQAFGTFISWISTLEGVTQYSSWQQVTLDWWVERALYGWAGRVDDRRTRHSSVGLRKIIFGFLAHMATRPYAIVRKLSQETLKDAFPLHYGARSSVGRLVGEKFADVSQSRQRRKGSGLSELSEELSDRKSVNVAAEVDIAEEDVAVPSGPRLSIPRARPTDPADEMSQAILTGASFVFGVPPMVRKLWACPKLLGLVIRSIIHTFCTKTEWPSVTTRVFNLLVEIVTGRNRTVDRSMDFEKFILADTVLPMLDILNSPDAGHWRVQLSAGAVVSMFLSPFPDNISDLGLANKLITKYFTFLLKSTDPTHAPPFVTSMALHSLTVLLHEKRRTIKELPTVLIDKLRDASPKIFDCLVLSFHEKTLAGPAKHQAYPAGAVKLVVEIVRTDITWPITRAAKSSHSLSLHNMLFAQTVTQTFHKLGLGTTAIVDAARRFGSQPPGDLEYHVALVELCSGALRAARRWDDRKSLWSDLAPIMAVDVQRFRQLQILDWCDGLRYASYKPSMDTAELVRELFAFVEENVSVKVEEGAGDVQDERSTAIFKKLILFRSLLSEIETATPNGVIERFLKSFCLGSTSPYKLIREEVARCQTLILKLVDKCPENFAKFGDSIHTYIKNRSSTLTEYIRNDKTVHPPEALRDPILCEVEDLLYAYSFPFLAHCGRLVFSHVVDSLLPLLYASLNHSDQSLSSLAWNTFSTFCLSSDHCGLLQVDLVNEVLEKSIASIEREVANQDAESWKSRYACVRAAEILGCALRLKLHNLPLYSRLIDVCVLSLKDPQQEIRLCGRQSLTSLFMTVSNQRCRELTTNFARIGGNPFGGAKETQLPAVLGLVALVQSAPYSLPSWLPETIKMLAEYGSTKNHDSVRVQVQKCLQEFMRTHQDMWTLRYKELFSEAQLEALELYKGRPVYFS